MYMQEIAVLLFALGIDYVLGDPRTAWHPVCLMGNGGYALEKRLRQPHLYEGENSGAAPAVTEQVQRKALFWRGVVAWFCVVASSLVVTYALLHMALLLGTVLGLGQSGLFVCTAVIIAFCLAPKSLAEHTQYIMLPLARGNLAQARLALSMIVGRDVQTLDAHAIARAGIESVGENVVDGVLATLFWATVGLLTFGLHGAALLAVMHRACNILDAQWGKKDTKYRYFGTCAARVDDALNYVPARLAWVCIGLAFMYLDAKAKGMWTVHSLQALQESRVKFLVSWKYRYAHASPNSAWSEAAFAAALGVCLGGPLSYDGRVVDYPYIGEGARQATVGHMYQAVRLAWYSIFLWLLGTYLLVCLGRGVL